MPLTDSGQRTTDDDFNQRALMTNERGERVIVVASMEAVEDRGWSAITKAANKKYDAGDFQTEDEITIVRVFRSDC